MTPAADSIHAKLLCMSLDSDGAKTVGIAARMIREQDAEIERLRARLEMIADIAEGSTTTNSLPHIAKIARGVDEQLRVW